MGMGLLLFSTNMLKIASNIVAYFPNSQKTKPPVERKRTSIETKYEIQYSPSLFLFFDIIIWQIAKINKVELKNKLTLGSVNINPRITCRTIRKIFFLI